MADTPNSSSTKSLPKRLLIHPVIWGFVIVLIGFLVWFFMGGISLISAPQTKEVKKVEPPPGQSLPAGKTVAAPPPPPSISVLKIQLSQVLSGVKEANQKKDLAKLLSYYSPNFPGLTNRAQSISKSWKTYNYLKMAYTLEDIKSLSADTASARVTWNVEAQNIDSLKSKIISKTYLINFIKQSGHWRIEAMHNEP